MRVYTKTFDVRLQVMVSAKLFAEAKKRAKAEGLSVSALTRTALREMLYAPVQQKPMPEGEVER